MAKAFVPVADAPGSLPFVFWPTLGRGNTSHSADERTTHEAPAYPSCEPVLHRRACRFPGTIHRRGTVTSTTPRRDRGFRPDARRLLAALGKVLRHRRLS